MAKGDQFLFINIVIIPVLMSFTNFASFFKKDKLLPENHAPVVKIIAPKNNSLFGWDAPINYSVSISDAEDGDSKYDEINPKEVLLTIKYAGDGSKLAAELKKTGESNSAALAAIRTSNCFNCHSFDGRLIGPSFAEISKRYPPTAANITMMVKRTREGSSGVWGKTSMPTHPELTKEQIQKMVEWILKNAANTSTSYYIGNQGSFRLKQPINPGRKAVYIITASYIDHGAKEDSTHRLSGQDVVVISNK
ncbi:MAG: c-type cytochrome [Ginsengibacter sp.]